ncbi:hypothetical protein N2152v2_005950 [Parachlorella kessleri]
MDAALRLLREGVTDTGEAPLLLLEDSLAAVGGPAIFLQVLGELAMCMANGRAQAHALTLVALERPPTDYQQLLSLQGLAHGQLRIVDCFSDPYGWLRPTGAQPLLREAVEDHVPAISLAGVLQQPCGLQALQQDIMHGAIALAATAAQAGQPGTVQPRQCVVVDSLSKLLDSFGTTAVGQWLHQLQSSARTSSLLCAVHADLHTPDALSTLQYLASGAVQLQPLSQLECRLGAAPKQSASSAGVAAAPVEGTWPHGRVAVRLKRRAGRVRTEAQLYHVLPGGSLGAGAVAFWDVPATMASAQAALPEAVAAATTATSVETSTPAVTNAALPAAANPDKVPAGGMRAPQGDSAAAGLAAHVEGGMRLSLTQEEEEARRRVQLPYEHQGQSTAYQTGDFRDYLPPAAGGHVTTGSGTARKLGHILYVRDSASEHDSDEDPDDDLDL